jgi:hypothetical protein
MTHLDRLRCDIERKKTNKMVTFNFNGREVTVTLSELAKVIDVAQGTCIGPVRAALRLMTKDGNSFLTAV